MKVPGLDRLGLGELVRDHQSTLYRIDDQGVHHPRWADRFVMWGGPILVGVFTTIMELRIYDPGSIQNGVAIISGGLFTLLVMIFGVQVFGSAAGKLRPAVVTLVRETRANVAYATAWSLLTTGTVMLVGAFKAPMDPNSEAPDPGISPLATGIVLAMLVHLALILLMVLNRIRLAFSRIDAAG